MALREPLAVATSLHARNGFSLNRGLVLWWNYNHHIASQLCTKDLLILYSDLLVLDEQALQQRLGPFLELHNHSRPTEDQARALITTLIRRELNRSEIVTADQGCASIHPILLEICNHAYKNIASSRDQLSSYKEHFNSMPRVVLECSVREQLFPDADFGLQYNRSNSVKSQAEALAFSLEESERERKSLQRKVRDIQNSRSWKITAPIRVLASFFKLAVR